MQESLVMADCIRIILLSYVDLLAESVGGGEGGPICSLQKSLGLAVYKLRLSSPLYRAIELITQTCAKGTLWAP